MTKICLLLTTVNKLYNLAGDKLIIIEQLLLKRKKKLLTVSSESVITCYKDHVVIIVYSTFKKNPGLIDFFILLL